MMAMAGALLLVAVTGGNATAQTEETSQTRRVRQTRLELTDAQKEQIAELRQQQREASAEAAAEIIMARAEIQSLMIKPDTDLNALQRAMNKLSELENAQKIQRMKNLQAYTSLLTDEQKSQMRSGLRGEMSFFIQGRMGDRSFTGIRDRQIRFSQGRTRSSRTRSTRGARSNHRGFGRAQQQRGNRNIPPMQGRFGEMNSNERGMRMRARIHAPGNTPPPAVPPPPPIL